MAILVVEDEKKLADILKRALTKQRYTVEVAGDGVAGLKKALKNNYGAIILDLMLPKMDGIQVCKELRRKGIHTPILMLTARTLLEDRIRGLDIGADDYISKPFEMTELFARIRAVLRRPKASESLIYKVGNLSMDTKSHEVTRSGRKIALTPKEYKILEVLLRQNGKALTREELLREAWGPNFKERNYELNVHMRYLRRKIDKKNSKPLIRTVRGVGYTLKAK